jgi:hypothetical protein
MSHPISQINLYAWVGEDEFSAGHFGIKQGIVPVRGSPFPPACIPLVSVEQGRMLDRGIPDAMKAQVSIYRKTIYLCRFSFAEEIKALNP